jgi:hypothetical protein
MICSSVKCDYVSTQLCYCSLQTVGSQILKSDINKHIVHFI